MSKYKVWYIPQIPMKAFEYETDSLEVAKAVEEALEMFSCFEFQNNVKPDYSDAGGIQKWNEDDHEWWDWEDCDDEY